MTLKLNLSTFYNFFKISNYMYTVRKKAMTVYTAESNLRALRPLFAVFGRPDFAVCGLRACSAPSGVYAM